MKMDGWMLNTLKSSNTLQYYYHHLWSGLYFFLLHSESRNSSRLVALETYRSYWELMAAAGLLCSLSIDQGLAFSLLSLLHTNRCSCILWVCLFPVLSDSNHWQQVPPPPLYYWIWFWWEFPPDCPSRRTFPSTVAFGSLSKRLLCDLLVPLMGCD